MRDDSKRDLSTRALREAYMQERMSPTWPVKEAYVNGALTASEMENAMALAVLAEDDPHADVAYSDEGLIVWVGAR